MFFIHRFGLENISCVGEKQIHCVVMKADAGS